MNTNKPYPQNGISQLIQAWKQTRAWLKTLQLKEKSSEQRRRHIVEMDNAIKAINEQITWTITVSECPRLLSWKRVADVCVLGTCLGVMAYAAFEIAKVIFK